MPILEECFVVALPKTHALARQTQIPMKALQNELIILPPLDVLPFYEQVVTLCQEVGFEPKIHSAVTVTGVVTILSLVAAGMGISILPNPVQTLHREGVVYRSVQDEKRKLRANLALFQLQLVELCSARIAEGGRRLECLDGTLQEPGEKL